MNAQHSTHSLWESNPFASRFVRPGAVEYLFAPNSGLDDVLGRLVEANQMGQIVGPHGSGKSTLTHTLVKRLEDQGKSVQQVTLNASTSIRGMFRRKLPGEQWVVDGFEQLAQRQQRRLIRTARAHGFGLLVTVHDGIADLPVLFRTNPSLDQVLLLVQGLTQRGNTHFLRSEVAGLYRRHAPDIRELLFQLYDLVEQRRQLGTGTVAE